MTHDSDGKLHPTMLSELIAQAQAVLVEHGDMPVWVEASVAGYDDSITASVPVGYGAHVADGRAADRYWPGRYARLFVVSGSSTG